MATARTGTITLAPKWAAGQEFTAIGSYAWPDSVVTGDTVTWNDLFPAGGVTVLDVSLVSVELDTNATPTATAVVGDGSDTDAFILSFIPGVNTTGNTKIIAPGDGALIGTTLSAATDVVLTIGGTVATAASSGTTWVKVRYYCSGLS